MAVGPAAEYGIFGIKIVIDSNGEIDLLFLLGSLKLKSRCVQAVADLEVVWQWREGQKFLDGWIKTGVRRVIGRDVVRTDGKSGQGIAARVNDRVAGSEMIVVRAGGVGGTYAS